MKRFFLVQAMLLLLAAAPGFNIVAVYGETATAGSGSGGAAREAVQERILNRLHEAMAADRWAEAKDLLLAENEGIRDMNRRFDRGQTLLHLAAGRGDCDICLQLIRLGADPNAGDDSGATPLHVACEMGQLACVPLLALKGANPNARNQNGETPLHLAVRQGHPRTVEALLRMGVDLSIQDRDGKLAEEYTADEELKACFAKITFRSPSGSDVSGASLEQECERFLGDSRLYASDRDEIRAILNDPGKTEPVKRKVIQEIIARRGVQKDPNLKTSHEVADERDIEMNGDPRILWKKYSEDERLEQADRDEAESILADPNSSAGARRRVIRSILALRGIVAGVDPEQETPNQEATPRSAETDPEILWNSVKGDFRLYASDREAIATILNNLELTKADKLVQIRKILSQRGITEDHR